jgi:AraC-like DNA-binding protein
MSPTMLMMQYTVALLGTLLAVGIGAHAWRQRSFGVGCLALWMATLAIVSWELTLMIRSDGSLPPPGRVVYGLLGILGGPLLLGYVIYAVRGVRLHWAWFLPFASYAAAYLVLGLDATPMLRPLRMTLIEYCYTAVAWAVCLRFARPLRSQLGVVGVLAAVTAFNGGQGLKFLSSFGVIDYHPLQGAPMLALILWFGVALIMALTSSPLLRRLVPSLTPPANDADRALFDRMETLMQGKRPWTHPEFDVGAMARMLDTYPNAVSRALSRGGNTTFYEYVNEHRIREARRLLEDPAEARIKVEALGRQAGFRGRSTFFKLFREHTGLTPAQYRASREAGLNA